jgi:hypothetical protein
MSDNTGPLNDADIHALLANNWETVARRAACRAATRIVWSRRIHKLNLVLTAAIMAVAFQVGLSLVLLAKLQGAAAQITEIARTALAIG